jgi:glycosyltransferase involved in cell wall biosynthesis
VKDLAALRANRWELVDPAIVAHTPDDYRRFLQGSKGELGIAKSGYVESQCGWFSDRSVCYLACGRPVVAQETGFSRVVPTGKGLFAFSAIEEALEAIEQVSLDYRKHCRHARDLAEAHFRSDRVLGQLLDSVGSTDTARRPRNELAGESTAE